MPVGPMQRAGLISPGHDQDHWWGERATTKASPVPWDLDALDLTVPISIDAVERTIIDFEFVDGNRVTSEQRIARGVYILVTTDTAIPLMDSSS